MSEEAFAHFYEEVHGHAPFPWQERLAVRVLRDGEWPEVLDLPTGVGKTSAIDIALFALAVDPERAPRRLFLVVDRRVIVDQAADHALKILSAMQQGRARFVAERLRRLFGGVDDDPPFDVAVLRGGMPRESDWARRPDVPIVVLSTVDQVGSRLLFRGYGVSSSMAPIHAGLLGQDALFLLDEVHLSRPFAHTLRQIRERWRRWSQGSDDVDRWEVVEMSATSGTREPDDVFGLEEDDRRNPVIAQRLRASKRTRLEVVSVPGRGKNEASKRQLLASAAAERARDAVDRGASAVAVVLNRVDSARWAWHELLQWKDHFDSLLLTGRMRPLERDRIFNTTIVPRALAGRQRSNEYPPLVVVATQTIEAGADLDFDALVTECASLDALKQRFGRVDRRGELGSSSHWVLIRSDQKNDSDDDPVYGSALQATWDFLGRIGDEVDFGIAALPQTEDEGLFAGTPWSPTIIPEYLDAWSSTSPRPEPDPEVAFWLHGVVESSPEVSIVWRAEVGEDDLMALSTSSEGTRPEAQVVLERISAALSACPPSPAEAISVPLHAARAWLAGDSEPPLADLVRAREPGASPDLPEASQVALRWTGAEVSAVTAGTLRPGDTLVVPTDRGGLSGANWDPEATAPVRDLGDPAQTAYGRTPTWRLRYGLIDDLEADGLAPPRVPVDESRMAAASIREWLDDAAVLARASEKMWVHRFSEVDGEKARWTLLPDGTFVLHGRRASRRPASATEEIGQDPGSLMGAALTLERHCLDAERWARTFVEHLRLSPKLGADLIRAARLHDLGKADPRFQMWLAGGSEVRLALQDEPLAKSAMPSFDQQRVRDARARSGYPQGERHELLSVHLLEQSEGALDSANDPDLVLHLVGSHHGWCRPFAPAVDVPEELSVSVTVQGMRFEATTRHRKARIDSGIADRFWRLTERYGWWGLAWLEALVRLADHRASEEATR